MESLQVRTGQIRLMILDDNGDERGIFKFNPEDVESARRMVSIKQEFMQKQLEFEAKADVCETEQERADLLSEMCTHFRGLVDKCFGDGTSNLVFGDDNSLTMFADFFEGITPYYEKASKARMAKYNKPQKKKN